MYIHLYVQISLQQLLGLVSGKAYIREGLTFSEKVSKKEDLNTTTRFNALHKHTVAATKPNNAHFNFELIFLLTIINRVFITTVLTKFPM